MTDASAKHPAFFFDRDGTVNVSPGAGYVLQWEQFQLMPGVGEMLLAVKDRGWRTILVTSQQGVGKGLMTQAALEDIHTRMQEMLGKGAFDGIYVASGLEGVDPRRKPNPAMIFEAAAEHHLDLARSWNIGDAERDMEMGRRAGVPHNILLGSASWPDWATVRVCWLAATSTGSQATSFR
jgi:D-glycero-D-manno-heptose 1,7-bisphosphate phosphatase